MLLTPGSYSKEIDGYAIKVENGNDQSFSGVTIHDYTEPHIIKTIKADSGTVYKSERGDYLLFKLKGGKVYEEMNAQAPYFSPMVKHSMVEAIFVLLVSRRLTMQRTKWI